jgi:membrane fusion protein (multidrug efflux system)
MKNKQILLFVVGITLMTTSCKSTKEKEVAAVYTVTTPEVTNTSVSKDYVANIRSQKNIEIRAQQEGILQDIYVDEGQTVRAGQPLFRIAMVGAQQEVEKSLAETQQASIDLQNTSRLASNNIVSKNARKMARAKLNAAMADYRLAQIRKRLSLIRAPFSGIIGRIPNKMGSLIQAGDLLSSLSDNSNMYVYFNVSEPEYLDYQQHAAERNRLPLTLILANGTSFGAKGYFQNVEGEFDNSTGNISFRAKFPNVHNLLRNGETGTLRMNIPVRNALIIPQQATYEVQDQKYVFVVDARGYVHARPIKIAFEEQNVYVISQGLSRNDRFLLDGVDKVNDGDRITCKYKSSAAAIQSVKLNVN